MGLFAGLNTNQKREVAAVAAGTAINGLSVNAAGKIVLGNDVGQTSAALTNSREIPMGNNTIGFSGTGKIVIGAATASNLSPLQIVQSLVAAQTTGALSFFTTWNTSGAPTLISAAVTNTASNAAALLVDLNVTGVSRFRVFSRGTVIMQGTSITNSVNVVYATFTPVGTIAGGNSGAGGQATALALVNTWKQSSGTTQQNAIGIQDQWGPTGGLSDCCGLFINSTINSTGVTGNYRGYYFNPTIISITGLLIGYENVVGDNYLNSGAAITPSRTVIGSNAVVASALLNVDSVTQGLLLPRMTTVQKNAIVTPVAGLMVYDLTLNKACIYTGAAWQTITSV